MDNIVTADTNATILLKSVRNEVYYKLNKQAGELCNNNTILNDNQETIECLVKDKYVETITESFLRYVMDMPFKFVNVCAMLPAGFSKQYVCSVQNNHLFSYSLSGYINESLALLVKVVDNDNNYTFAVFNKDFSSYDIHNSLLYTLYAHYAHLIDVMIAPATIIDESIMQSVKEEIGDQVKKILFDYRPRDQIIIDFLIGERCKMHVSIPLNYSLLDFHNFLSQDTKYITSKTFFTKYAYISSEILSEYSLSDVNIISGGDINKCINEYGSISKNTYSLSIILDKVANLKCKSLNKLMYSVLDELKKDYKKKVWFINKYNKLESDPYFSFSDFSTICKYHLNNISYIHPDVKEIFNYIGG